MLPETESHILAVLSLLDVIICELSRLNTAEVTTSVCPLRTKSSAPDSESHTLAVLSLLAVKI